MACIISIACLCGKKNSHKAPPVNARCSKLVQFGGFLFNLSQPHLATTTMVYFLVQSKGSEVARLIGLFLAVSFKSYLSSFFCIAHEEAARQARTIENQIKQFFLFTLSPQPAMGTKSIILDRYVNFPHFVPIFG